MKLFDETTSSQKTSCQTHLVVWQLVVSNFNCFNCFKMYACLFKYITVAALCIDAQHGEDAAKRVGWRPCIK